MLGARYGLGRVRIRSIPRTVTRCASGSIAGDAHPAKRLAIQSLAAKEHAGAGDIDIGRTTMNSAELSLSAMDLVSASAHAARAAAVLERAAHPRLLANSLSVLALTHLNGGNGGDADAALQANAGALALLDGFGDDHALQALLLARHSVVLHAAGRGRCRRRVTAPSGPRGGGRPYSLRPRSEPTPTRSAEERTTGFSAGDRCSPTAGTFAAPRRRLGALVQLWPVWVCRRPLGQLAR